jgi:hypothetical protein
MKREGKGTNSQISSAANQNSGDEKEVVAIRHSLQANARWMEQ